MSRTCTVVHRSCSIFTREGAPRGHWDFRRIDRNAVERRHRRIVEPRRWMHRVTRDSGVSFTLHDLRRTFATVAESLDISPYTLKRLLNHKAADVTAGYLIIDAERLRDPMQRITDYILKAAGAKPTAEVVPIKPTARRPAVERSP